MATYYIDFVNGNDANTGASWAQAWKTVLNGSTAARIAPGDTIRMAKSPDKVSLGNGTWTPVTSNATAYATTTVTGATNASPIQITTSTSHGYATGDIVQINSVGGNTAANGTWIITSTGATTFTLDGSTGNGAYTSGGIAQNVNFRAVKLASNTSTKLISDVYLGWSNANGSTLAADTTYVKSTPEARQLTAPASAANNTKYAFAALGSTQDFSAYTHITLWVRSNTATMTANTWRVCLCSDTTGDVIVDSFPLPAITTVNQLNSLVIAKSGGGALGSSIQSVAIYSGPNSLNSSVISFDNINACTDTGLNLQSLISPVASNTDVADNYPIAAIINNIVLLDNAYTTPNLIPTSTVSSNPVRGYSGTGGTVTTYYRNAIDYARVNSLAYASISVLDCTEAGSRGSVTTWSGGWNTGTDTQDSLSIIYIPAGSSGWTPRDFVKIENSGVLRGVRGFGTNLSQGRSYSGWTIQNCFTSGATIGYNSPGVSTLSGTTYPNIINNFGITNAGNAGFVTTGQLLNCDTIKCYNSGILGTGSPSSPAVIVQAGTSTFKNFEVTNTSQACFQSYSPETTFYTASGKYSGFLMYTDTGGGYWYNVTSQNNGAVFASSISNNGGNIYIENFNYNEATVFNSTSNLYTYSTIFAKNINGNVNDFLGYSYYAAISRETSITHSGSSSWKVTIQNPWRDANFPEVLKLAEVYCTANQSTTISVWIYLTNSSMAANLVLPGRQIAGVNNDVSASANSATTGSWQQVSINFTPTANGVVKVYANVWSTGASNESVYIDDLTLPTGIATTNLEQSLLGLPWAQNQASVTCATQAYACVGL